MNEFRPDSISSYGSYVEALFVHLKATGEPFHRPKLVRYGSDGLSDSARRLITGEFGIPLLSGYNAIETPPLGFECEAHSGLHLNIDLCAVRIVDSTGREVRDGESGDVVISNLVNRGTVLLNYRLGDVTRWLPEPCPCGRNLPMVAFLEGRSQDWLTSPSGEPVHPQAVKMLLRTEDQVFRYQVVQRTPAEFDLAIVVSPECDREGIRRRLELKFRERFGDGTVADVSFVESLPRTGGGKVRPVISRAGHPGNG
jgi:phenylacetate-CoA ligase